MRTDLKDFSIEGSVERVETTVVDISTKAYRLSPSGRQELEDFNSTPNDSSGSALLWELLKFNADGKLTEDVDFERPFMEQESYRYIYAYNRLGLLAERVGYRKDGSPDGKNTYVYNAEGRKIEQLNYSGVGAVESQIKFDAHENIVSILSYQEDGKIRLNQSHHYEYVRDGNTLEQIYYPPEAPLGVGVTFYAASAAVTEQSNKTVTANRFRTVFVHDDAGRVREESRYLPDGSLLERKIFDEKGVLRNREWRIGDMTVTTTIFDERGREIGSHTTAKKGFGSPRAVDDRTLFSYDEHGNLAKMVTNGPDGSLLGGTANVFEYDSLGNWVKKTESVLKNTWTWKTESFTAAFESIREFHRAISYFQD
jgi:hypothetical protein